ncbi:MAG: DUF4142 domain-containing protein [Porticoccaceae bacterium]
MKKVSIAVMGCVLLSLGSAWVHAGELLDDATILAIFDEANTVDIWIGRIGLQQGHSDEVRSLAKMVVTDHESVQQMGRDLANSLRIVPTPPANDRSADDLAETVSLLQSKQGVAFDEAYLRREITFHQGVIDAIQQVLLPAIQNDQFKELVEKVLPGFEHHLAATKHAADELGISY